MVRKLSGDLNDVQTDSVKVAVFTPLSPFSNDIAIYNADVFVYHSHTLESWTGSLDPNLKIKS